MADSSGLIGKAAVLEYEDNSWVDSDTDRDDGAVNGVSFFVYRSGEVIAVDGKDNSNRIFMATNVRLK